MSRVEESRKKILFIHHGSHDGGAPLSMLYTMNGAKEGGFEVVAGLLHPSKELHKLYNDANIVTLELREIPRFLTSSGSEGRRLNPLTWIYTARALMNWKKGQKQLERVLVTEKIDIVHLNSASLSNPAMFLNKKGLSFVWHVREHGPKHQGLRFRFIQKQLEASRNVIFLSNAERDSWIRKSNHGKIVPNFLDLSRFTANHKLGEKQKMYLDKKVILFVGGFHQIKGIDVLVEALKIVKEKYGENFICLMPGAKKEEQKQSAYYNKIYKKLQEFRVIENCEILPFSKDIIDLYARCDVLVFPAVVPHFARPVIEASAMKKPVIASDLPVIDELVIHNKTGFLIEANNPTALGKHIIQIFNNEELANSMGEFGYIFAKEEFEFKSQMKKILAIYKTCL